MWDMIIKNGRMIDGSGNPWTRTDIAIKDLIIAKIGEMSPDPAKVTIDAKGLIVSPGFIDIHSHSDFTIPINPKAESKIRQGVTTEVVGNCGMSFAPLNDEVIKFLRKENPIIAESEVELDWTTMREYLEKMEKLGTAVNFVPLVGHSTIRAYIMGSTNKRPVREELNKMKELAAQAMREGAFGLSSGLIYPPGCYADTAELIELCKTVAQYGGIYTSHIRGEGETLFKAVKEAIRIGKSAQLPVEISHLKLEGRENWGQTKKLLSLITDARSMGIDISADAYPYTAGCFSLGAMFPPWTSEGGVQKLVERLKDQKTRGKIREEMVHGRSDWSSPLRAIGWDKTIIIYCRKAENRGFEGKAVSELSRAKDVDPFDFVFDLAIDENAETQVIRFSMSEEDVRTIVKHPLIAICSDGSALATYGVLARGKPHPRYYGTFPRVLRKFVAEEGTLRIEDAIRKMTSLPAQRLRLEKRGLIKEGYYADMVVFDPKKIKDTATFIQPKQYPIGIECVIVNGTLVIHGKNHTNGLPGSILRKGGTVPGSTRLTYR
jgi:N-acyl-D-amino-acid deacylase